MRLQTYLDIGQSSSLPTLERQLVDFTHELGFALVSAVVISAPPGQRAESTWVGNTPEAYESFDDFEITRKDPVIRRLGRTSVPLFYDQDMYVNDGAGEMWEEQALHGYKTGIAVALHLPDHKHFLIGFDRNDPLPGDLNDVAQMMASLQLLAVHALDATWRLATPVPVGPAQYSPRVLLTPRELEVLGWTMEGKSSWAVGEILAISENTVNFHMRNAVRKLDSSSKYQAVLKAIRLGIL